MHQLLKDTDENLCPGGSVIVSPAGEIIAGPLFNKKGILISEIDLDETSRHKFDFDVNGHYSRKDIFEFKVNGQPMIKKELELK